MFLKNTLKVWAICYANRHFLLCESSRAQHWEMIHYLPGRSHSTFAVQCSAVPTPSNSCINWQFPAGQNLACLPPMVRSPPVPVPGDPTHSDDITLDQNVPLIMHQFYRCGRSLPLNKPLPYSHRWICSYYKNKTNNNDYALLFLLLLFFFYYKLHKVHVTPVLLATRTVTVLYLQKN